MRVRTEDRRKAILAAAQAVFEEMGPERATMSDIARRVGGSKATLYGYFPSKEDLLFAVVQEDIEAQAANIMDSAELYDRLDERLGFLAFTYLKKLVHPQVQAMRRVIAAQPEENGLGRRFYDDAIWAAWTMFSKRVEAAMAEGKLRKADPMRAAIHLKSLIDGEILERGQFRALEGKTGDAYLKKLADGAVDTFLRAYAPEPAEI